MRKSRVGLVLRPDNKSWIIEKIAKRLQEYLPEFGFQAEITEQPLTNVNINHHMSWAFANMKSNLPSTMFITHLDDIYKIQQVKSELGKYITAGICMSNDTVNQLISFGVQKHMLCFIPPAHDSLVKYRRIVIGITTRLYPDGRKRENLLIRLANDLQLNAFEFMIFGKGWKHVIIKLEKAGARVLYYEESDDFIKDYESLLEKIPKFDYYLYLGMDEGSLGTLDALAAGVKTIITPQGFHLDIPHGITYPVVEYQDVLEVFRSLSNDLFSRIKGVSNLTWREYARRHSLLWRHLIEKGPDRDIQTLLFDVPKTVFYNNNIRSSVGGSRKYILFRALKPRRILSALSHLPLLKPFRSLLRRGRKS